ncbi:MAG: hypothetical protein AAF961_04895 [Planctomycetota bacterium]
MPDLEQFNDEHVYDRLADGELSAAERRELLASLDGRTDGWRRCAIALLEAQSMAAQLKACVAEETSESSSQRLRAVHADSLRKGRRAAGAWMAAAAVAVAFGMGRFSGGPPPATGVDADRAVADRSLGDRDPEPTETIEEALVRSDASQVRGERPDENVLTLVVRGQDGAPQRVQLPLVESGGLDRRLGAAGRWTPPAGLVRQLRDSGLEVETRRRYAPVIFERSDGIVPMVVPVDDAYLRPVDRRIY